ncbi:MAG: TfoX/Sxy family protein, partial [Actinobacteria bacterium]|nr:TfoX/Sxy family protein [Actinomycetota bacterium]
MFGGHGVYSRGAIVAIVIDGVLYLKADEALAEE